MKNTTKLILALVIINLFAISFYLVKNAMQHQQEGRAEQESAVKAGQAWEKIGLMSQKDHARLYKLRYSVK